MDSRQFPLQKQDSPSIPHRNTHIGQNYSIVEELVHNLISLSPPTCQKCKIQLQPKPVFFCQQTGFMCVGCFCQTEHSSQSTLVDLSKYNSKNLGWSLLQQLQFLDVVERNGVDDHQNLGQMVRHVRNQKQVLSYVSRIFSDKDVFIKQHNTLDHKSEIASNTTALTKFNHHKFDIKLIQQTFNKYADFDWTNFIASRLNCNYPYQVAFDIIKMYTTFADQRIYILQQIQGMFQNYTPRVWKGQVFDVKPVILEDKHESEYFQELIDLKNIQQQQYQKEYEQFIKKQNTQHKQQMPTITHIQNKQKQTIQRKKSSNNKKLINKQIKGRFQCRVTRSKVKLAK